MELSRRTRKEPKKRTVGRKLPSQQASSSSGFRSDREGQSSTRAKSHSHDGVGGACEGEKGAFTASELVLVASDQSIGTSDLSGRESRSKELRRTAGKESEKRTEGRLLSLLPLSLSLSPSLSLSLSAWSRHSDGKGGRRSELREYRGWGSVKAESGIASSRAWKELRESSSGVEERRGSRDEEIGLGKMCEVGLREEKRSWQLDGDRRRKGAGLLFNDANRRQSRSCRGICGIRRDVSAGFTGFDRKSEQLAGFRGSFDSPRFEHFVDMLYGKETLAMTKVKALLNSNEIQRGVEVKHEEAIDALAVRGRPKKWESKAKKHVRSKSKGKMKCFFCHKEGQTKHQDKEKSSRDTSCVEEGHESSDALVISNIEPSKESILDSSKLPFMHSNFDLMLLGKSRIHGFGVFAKLPHRAGDMILSQVIEYSGELVRPSIADIREHCIYNSLVGAGTYMFRIDNERVIDATKAGSIAHLINHSCEPNCYSRVISVNGDEHIIIFAKRDISQWEELAYDYRFFSKDELACYCGFPRCRGIVNDIEERLVKIEAPRSDLINWDGE
ncbi:hypothetical protein KFK09_005506 [Dendrobium nobile]|uniref:[histone H3]-lysine(4) N-trimethyltransferase n=1 Tax=Dendrobium nobile TaxID=94219 RepID=A0A8T3C1I2_DENNO|nr:hypothetical protein KFK09_005506 [Dendrobium nobile]